MRSLHDALRAAFAHLPQHVRSDFALVFRDEALLAVLSTRLLLFSRHGVPEQHPPPHFASECTPSLANAFDPFRAAVASWHDAPDSPDVPPLFADALSTSGIRNVLVLLGQRFTPASLTDGRALPPAREKLLRSALAPHSSADRLSVAARALAKHANRETGDFWGSVSGSTDEKNACASAVLDRILDGATWWNTFGHYKHITVYEVRVVSGHGARWGHGGDEFIGFLEPFQDD